VPSSGGGVFLSIVSSLLAVQPKRACSVPPTSNEVTMRRAV
jgi:hypothetical protein